MNLASRLKTNVWAMFFVGSLCSNAWAAVGYSTITVDTTRDEFNDIEVTTGSCSLREAIASVNDGAGSRGCTVDGDVGDKWMIELPDLGGEYQLTIANTADVDADGDLDLHAAGVAVTIIGTGSDRSIISGAAVAGGEALNARLLDISDGTAVTLEHLQLEYGTTIGAKQGAYGGCVYAHGTTGLTVTDVQMNNCTTRTSWGGALAFFGIDTELAISSSVFKDNHVSDSSCGGGALYIHGQGTATFKVFDSTFHNNSAVTAGGAIHMNGVTALVSQCTFSNNAAIGLFSAQGGAIDSGSNPLVLENSYFTGNSASGAGAVKAGSTDILISECTFEDNRANSGAGAVDISPESSGGVGRIENTVVSMNTGGYGGGVSFGRRGTKYEIVQSQISGNEASAHGGGIYHDAQSLIIENSTIADNISMGGGGAITSWSNPLYLSFVTLTGNIGANTGGLYADDDCYMKNSIIYGNKRVIEADTDSEMSECEGTVISLGNNVIGSTSDETGACSFTGDTDADILGEDPLLAVMADNGGSCWSQALPEQSVAVDFVPLDQCGFIVVDEFGNMDTGLDTADVNDQRDLPRPVGDRCDAGAFEFAPEPVDTETEADSETSADTESDSDVVDSDAVDSSDNNDGSDADSGSDGDSDDGSDEDEAGSTSDSGCGCSLPGSQNRSFSLFALLLSLF